MSYCRVYLIDMYHIHITPVEQRHIVELFVINFMVATKSSMRYKRERHVSSHIHNTKQMPARRWPVFNIRLPLPLNNSLTICQLLYLETVSRRQQVLTWIWKTHRHKVENRITPSKFASFRVNYVKLLRMQQGLLLQLHRLQLSIWLRLT